MKVYSTCCCIAINGLLLLSFYTTEGQPDLNQHVLQHPVAEKGLFESDELLQVTLKGNLHDLFNDRSDKPKNFPLILSCVNDDSTEVNIPVEVKKRGHFRRLLGNCIYSPLLIRFSKDTNPKSSVFREQKKLKLVMPCRSDDYVVREWLVYKLYNLFTDKSFRARLVKVKLEDGKKKGAAFYGIFLEEEKQMAKRNRMITVDKKIKPEHTQGEAFLTMAVFQYMIGNTDWSVEYLQNIKLLAPDTNDLPVAVPYDFDHAGIVNAPYAQPAELLNLKSVRERRYRGYCVSDLAFFEPVIEKCNRLKNDIYKVITGCTMLDEKYKKSTVQYLDEFYTTINTAKAWQKAFAYPCDKYGTGNVIIKGLKEE